MYKCEECSNKFDKPIVIKEFHNEFPDLPYETFSACPFCESTQIERNDTNDKKMPRVRKRI